MYTSLPLNETVVHVISEQVNHALVLFNLIKFDYACLGGISLQSNCLSYDTEKI